MALVTYRATGSCRIAPGVQEVDGFLLCQSVDALPGVGWSAQEKLQGLGVKTVADLRSFDKTRLQAELGPRTAEDMWQYAWGKDLRQVRPASFCAHTPICKRCAAPIASVLALRSCLTN